LGRNPTYLAKIFPKQSITVLDTFANIGLLFFLFMVGLELDLRALRRVGSQAMSIAAAGMVLPFALGAGVSILIRNTLSPSVKFAPFLVFMGVAMSITAFPVLARILAERKLLTTDVGQMAMSAAAVNDVSAWILLALAVALSGTNTSGTVAIWVLLCGLAFVIVMFVVVKPFMTWVARQSPENEPIKEIYVAITFALVLVAGFTTDAIGIHLIFGGFVFGLVIPKEGTFAQGLIEKLEDFVSVLLLPLYFASSGLKTNVASIHGGKAWALLVLVIFVACFGKIVGTVFVSRFYTKSLRKSFTLGFLMNTKGLVELIVLNIGKDRGVSLSLDARLDS
jgi:Kef-type K+ transport system membrane component KefB